MLPNWDAQGRIGSAGRLWDPSNPEAGKADKLLGYRHVLLCMQRGGKLMGKERRETGGRHFCELFLVLHEMNSLFMFFLLDCDCEISLWLFHCAVGQDYVCGQFIELHLLSLVLLCDNGSYFRDVAQSFKRVKIGPTPTELFGDNKFSCQYE